jgi:hypothetical protein
LLEVNELMLGWEDHTPTNILVKALLEGLGGGKANKTPTADEFQQLAPEAMKAMQDSAMEAIVAKAGNRLPVTRGRDKGLPHRGPIFDVELLRDKNDTVAKTFRKGSVNV